MSTRERALLIVGLVGALLLVLYPLAYRITKEQATAADRPATARPIITAAAATGRPGASSSAPPSSGPGLNTEAAWHANATEHRGDIESTFEYKCLAGGSLNPVWGTDFYTDDSSICTAGVHAGLITLAEGGTVKIKILAGMDSYVGSTRNGVRSSPFDRWLGSYVFVTS